MHTGQQTRTLSFQEFNELTAKLDSAQDQDMDSHLLFNLCVVNVIWAIVSGKR